MYTYKKREKYIYKSLQEDLKYYYIYNYKSGEGGNNIKCKYVYQFYT